MPPALSTPAEDVGPRPEIRPDPGQQLLEREWLRQVVIGPEVEALDPVIHPPPGAQHQDRNRGAPLAQALQHVQPVQVGQAEIEDHHTDVRVHGPPKRIAPGAHPLDAVAVRAEPFHQERGDALLVLDDEQLHWGIRIQNVAPSPGRLPTPASPPCALAIPRTMASPSPVPPEPDDPVVNGSNSFSS